MPISARARTAIAAASMLPILLPGAASADWSSQKSARVDALVSHFLTPRIGGGEPPALSLAIGVGGQLVLAKGYGQARAGAAATEQTVYHVGSLTKQFTAAAVLRLIEDGARAPIAGDPLTLDTPMRAIFEGVDKWTSEEEPAITVRSLLTMTSNLPNFTKQPPPDVDPWGAVEAPRLLAALKQLPPHGWPNTFEYSNTSYFLLARIVEAVIYARQGRPITSRDYVRAAILAKAGMSRTGFVGDYAPGSDLAAPHHRRRPAFAEPDWLNGCGDMSSNVVDLFAWNRALMDGRIIGADSRRIMFSDAARVGPLTYYGMGWFVGHEEGWDSFSHSGSVPGFTSYNAILRRHASEAWLSVTLLTNSDGVEGLDQLADELFYLVREP